MEDMPTRAGCSLEKEEFDNFHQKFTEVCNRLFPRGEKRTVRADLEVKREMLTSSLVEKLKVFEPYGQENRKPVFMLSNITLQNPVILTGKHLKWTMETDLELIYWNGAGTVELAEYYNIACTLGENIFRGVKKRQLIVSAITAGHAK